MDMDTIEVKIDDEVNGRQVVLMLTPVQYERAQREPDYVAQLLHEYDINNENQSVNNLANHTENQVVNNVPSPTEDQNVDSESRSIFIWNEQCIQLLLTLYEEHKEEFERKRHKSVYETIAKKMKDINSNYDITGAQCQSKIISLKKTYKKIVDHNATSGNDRATWPYFDRMNELFGSTGWANPVALASELLPAAEENSTPETQPKRRKLDSVLEEYRKDMNKYREERAKVKQENFLKLLEIKEKHHQEKMELLRHFLSKN